MKNLYLFVLIALFPITISGQNFTENKDLMDREAQKYLKMINYNVNPNTLNYDLKYQRLEVYLDPAVLQIAGSVTSHFLPNTGISSIYFDLTNLLTVSEVTYHGTVLPFQQLATKELKIDFPSAISANTLDSLTVKYSGIPDNSGRTSFYMGTHNGNPVLSTLSEPYGAQNWFPTKQSMNDKIDTFDFKITTPDQYSVAANGKFMSENILTENKKLTFWRTQYPTAAYLIAFSIGDFSKTNDVIGNPPFPFVNYIYPDTAANPAVVENLEWTKTAMAIFEEHFGPYPFSNEKYGHMEFAVNGAAMEHQTMSSMNSFAKSTIAHELAHQWFGDKITCGSWNDIWLNEGFANFSEQLVNEKNLMNATDFMNYLLNNKNIVTSLPNGKLYINDSDLGNIPIVFSGRLTYTKGGYVLRMIKWILGDSAFYQMMRDYTSNPNFAYQYATTEDFKNQILISSGEDFTGFFNDWIYGEGYPIYTIKWNQPIVNQSIKFQVSQIQSDTSVDFFEMPLPIRITGINGEIADLVLDNTVNNQFFSEFINFQVATVAFNAEHQMLEKNSTVIYDSALGTAAIEKESFVLLPNPVADFLYVKGITKRTDYEIFSMDGKLIKIGKITTSDSIDVSTFTAGIYLIKLNGKSLKFTKK